MSTYRIAPKDFSKYMNALLEEYGDSVILIYRGFCYVFTENNGLKTVYKNDRVRM